MHTRDVQATTVASSYDVSARNRVRVLESLIKEGPSSRVAIARATGMNPATVNRLTAALMRRGLVDQAGNDETTGGRPSMLVKFQPRARTILAIDLWENAIEIALLDLTGRIINRSSLDWQHTSARQKLELVKEVIAEWDACEEHTLVAVGVSVPGPVSSQGQVLLAPALEWYDLDVLQELQYATDVPITLENDVNLIAYAEYRHLLSPDHKTLVAMAVFQGVGAGIVEDGRLWRGNQGAAGQFGRMLRDPSGLHHKRYGFGHLETELGSGGILQRAIDARVVSPEVESADVVFAAAQDGDLEALEMVESVADEYAFHLVNVCAMIAPDIVVFGGLFERWSGLLIPMIRQRLEGNVINMPELRTAELGDEGKLIGAGMYAFENAGGLTALVAN
ncbi:ROK family transcriptional regulator [Actinomycetaceae bacterium MB13-C1-2]|nr:ROK family transcriptional regulator [Actinomycetaceae bacterium MB13-C1-2]